MNDWFWSLGIMYKEYTLGKQKQYKPNKLYILHTYLAGAISFVILIKDLPVLKHKLN